MKIIVGLGNPGAQYRHTRHNLGFAVLDLIAGQLNAGFDREKHNGLIAQTVHAGEKLLLVKPLTYMNCSGDCVAPLARNKIQTLDELLVVADDVNLPLGKMRMRAGGSAGGHNGLKSIVERMGSEAFHRLRLGVGDDRAGQDLAGHVLSTFRPEEKAEVQEMLKRAAEAVFCWLQHGIERAMCQFN